MNKIAQYMTSGTGGSYRGTATASAEPEREIVPVYDMTGGDAGAAEPEEEIVPISAPATGLGADEVNLETLGRELVSEATKKNIPLQQAIDDGTTTYEKLGEKFNAQNPNSSMVAKHRYRSWGEGVRDFLEDLPEIPNPVELGMEGQAMVQPFFRGIASGMTLGATEQIDALFPGTYQPPDDLRYDVGNFLGSLAPYAVAYRGLKHGKEIQRMLTSHPKLRRYLEEMLVGGSLEGFRGLMDPEGDAVVGGLTGVAGGGITVAAGAGLKAGKDLIAGSFVRPPTGTGSLSELYPTMGPWVKGIVEFFGNAKQGLDLEFKKTMDKYGIPYAPALLRPRDPGVRLATKKVSRATAAMPDLDAASRQMDQAVDRIEDDIVATLAPKNMQRTQVPFKHATGLQGAYEQVPLPTSTDTGLIIRKSVRETVDRYHNEADQLYEAVAEVMGEHPIKTKNVVDRIEAMLKRQGYDEQTTNAQARQVRNVLRDLRQLGKESDVPTAEEVANMSFSGSDAAEQMMAMTKLAQSGQKKQLADAKYKWLYNQYKALAVPGSGPFEAGDHIKFAARDIIKDELSSATASFSDEAASIMLKANTAWGTYKALRWPKLHTDESQLAKQLYESDGSNTIATIFKSVPNIREARRILGTEGFELARIRHLKNLLYNRQPKGTMPNAGPESTHDLKPSIDIANFNSVIDNAGGASGEMWEEMFRGEPDKYSAFLELNKVVNRVAPVRQAYAGVAEEAGGGEQGSIVGLVGAILSRSSMFLHFAGTKGLGKELTKPAGENVFLGAPWKSQYRPATGRGLIPEAQNKPGQPLQLPESMGWAGQKGAKARQSVRDVTGRDVMKRAVPTQATARLLGGFLKD